MRIAPSGAGSAAIRMFIATVLTGLAAGVAGTALTLLLHAVQHLAFGYTENTFLIGVEHAVALRRVLAVAAGGVVAGVGWWLHRRRFGTNAVSVTHALREIPSRLPVIATFTDAVLQIVAVGAGASLGREGAPRQAGAASGGWIASRLRVTPGQQHTLLACGAGAGLAAVYNVPLGGAAFTMEILLGSAAISDAVPALLTAAIATVIAWPILSDRTTYPIAAVHLSAAVLVWAVVLGPVAGMVGVGFVRLTSAARSHAPQGWRSAFSIVVVFTALGAAAIAYPELLGNGKGLAGLGFEGTLSLGLAGALVLLKPLATAACVGAGAIGGLLTPSLATGAALGVFGGRLWSMLWPGATVAQYAIVGAAAVLAVTQRAPITAIILTLEFVGTGLALLVPMLTVVALGMLTAWHIDKGMAPVALTRSRTVTATRQPPPAAV